MSRQKHSILFVITSLLFLSVNGFDMSRKIIPSRSRDTIFAGQKMANSSLLKNEDSKFVMLIRNSRTNNYTSIKYLDKQLRLKGDKLLIVQKLYNGAYVNIDSVIVDASTLAPVESYSDINISKDSFIYKKNEVTGTMKATDGAKKGVITKIDTVLPKLMFNGLIYPETYQALNYHKGKSFCLAEYVPGHNTKYTLVTYIKDDTVTIADSNIPAKVLELKTGRVVLNCWINAKDQEMLKIEGDFPGFKYYLYRIK